MVIHQNGVARDTIPCEMTIESVTKDSIWTWKTVYKGDQVITKDYRMILPDPGANYYILDEGDGLELRSYAIGNTMFSNFSVQGSLLTSRYSLEEDQLIFEITSGQVRDTTTNDIINYSVPILQRSVLKRSD